MTRKTVHLIEGTHVTATDKRHILALVEKSWSTGQTRQARYSITESEGETFRVRIEKRERSDLGRPLLRRIVVKIEIRGGPIHD